MTVTVTGEAVTVTIAGELDPVTTPSVAGWVAEVLDGRPERLIFDLRRVGFMDSAAARLIAGTGQYLPGGARPVVLAPSAAVRRVMRLNGLDAYCEIVALSIAGEGAPMDTHLTPITIACLDMAGTTVRDDGTVLAAFDAAIGAAGRGKGTPEYQEAAAVVRASMGMSKIEVFRRILGDGDAAARANAAFEEHYAAAVRAGRVAAMDGAVETITRLRQAGIRVCLLTGFSPATRDAILDVLGWDELVDLALSPVDAGRGRPFPDLPLTALLRLGGGAVGELAVVGDTPSDVESGLRAGAGLVAGVLTGSSTREQLAEAGAPAILGSIADLPGVLELG